MTFGGREQASTLMARVDSSDFANRETCLIFLARNVREATRVEALLNGQEIDYTIELERYVTGIIVASERSGLGFHVLAGQAEFCRALLRPRFRVGVVEESARS